MLHDFFRVVLVKRDAIPLRVPQRYGTIAA
jgi:hypothetical protein